MFFYITIIVFSMNTDIVSWNDFLEQNISAVSMESVIFSIKGFVMRVPPAVASTFCIRQRFKTKLNTMHFQCIYVFNLFYLNCH